MIGNDWNDNAAAVPENKRGMEWKTFKSVMSIFSLLLLCILDTSEAFLCPSCTSPRGTIYKELYLAEFLTPDIIEQARTRLSWETQLSEEAKPVLNLSARDFGTLSLAEGADFESMADEDEPEDKEKSWTDGHVWQDTEQNLLGMGLLITNNDAGTKLTPQKAVAAAPQLIRLPTSQVVESASYLLSYSNSSTLTNLDPSLLTYLAEDL